MSRPSNELERTIHDLINAYIDAHEFSLAEIVGTLEILKLRYAKMLEEIDENDEYTEE